LDKIRIAVDAMGGDFAPESEIRGSIEAALEKSKEIEVILVGKEEVLKNKITGLNLSVPENFSIVNAKDVIAMDESPSDSLRNKPESSLSVSISLQKENKADACISAGNTGANMAHSTFKLGRLKGIGRPTIGTILPSANKISLVIDAGASVDCKPRHLLEFAVMGSIYMNTMFKVENPRVGLLSIGEEKSKGNELTFQAFELLEKSSLNFVGNVEGGDILRGNADIFVCDGFIGNIILKFAESILDLLKYKFKAYSELGLIKKLKTGIIKGVMKESLSDFDYQNYGGVPLLGVNGVSLIGHGKSSSLAIKNMIFKAEEMVRKEVNKKIETEISKYLEK
jgi:glycerol-3-phosphate acyltransferase PlsX